MVEAERGKSEVRRGRRDKNDPIDRLRPGPRIDGHLSPASVISPTNHDVTSTGQYHTLQASSSGRTPASLRLHAQLDGATAALPAHQSGC